MDGIQVVMATHNGAQWLKRAIDSVEDVLYGRQWVLGVAVDGYDDPTRKLLRSYVFGDGNHGPTRNNGRLSAQRYYFHEFPKGRGVGVAKNAALGMLQEFRESHPWILFMDDDDEMVP